MTRSTGLAVSWWIVLGCFGCLPMIAGCASPSAGTSSEVPLVAPPASAKNAAAPGGPVPTITANNARDLAAAQPDSVITHPLVARDLGDAGETVTMQSLQAMLTGMGLTPKAESTGYTVTVQTQIGDIKYTFPISILFSGDKSVLWIETGLGDVRNSRADALLVMLQDSWKLGIDSFAVDDRGMLTLHRPLANRYVTGPLLGQNLKQYFDALKAVEPVYRSILNPAAGGGGQSGNPFN